MLGSSSRSWNWGRHPSGMQSYDTIGGVPVGAGVSPEGMLDAADDLLFRGGSGSGVTVLPDAGDPDMGQPVEERKLPSAFGPPISHPPPKPFWDTHKVVEESDFVPVSEVPDRQAPGYKPGAGVSWSRWHGDEL